MLRRSMAVAGMMVALVTALMPGCSRKSEGPNTLNLRFWGDTEEIRILNGLVAEFNRDNPGADVRLERKSADASYTDMLLLDMAAGTMPDVLFAAVEALDKPAIRSGLADISELAAQDSELKLSDYYPAALERMRYGGRLYALPRDVAPIACVFYNKAIFDAAGRPYPKDGWSWKDLRETAVALTKRDTNGRTTQYGFAEDGAMLEPWIFSSGGAMLDDVEHPRRIMLDSPEALRGLQFRWNLLNIDRVMPSVSDDQNFNAGTMGLFMEGRAAMFLSGYWKTPALRKIEAFDWDVAMFPKGPTGKRGFMMGVAGYAMAKDCRNPGLAWKLLKWLSGAKGQEQLAKAGLAQPALRKLANSPVFLDDQKPLNKKMLISAAEIGTPQAKWDQWLEFHRGVWTPKMDLAWQRSPQESLEATVKSAVAEGNAKFFKAAK